MCIYSSSLTYYYYAKFSRNNHEDFHHNPIYNFHIIRNNYCFMQTLYITLWFRYHHQTKCSLTDFGRLPCCFSILYKNYYLKIALYFPNTCHHVKFLHTPHSVHILSFTHSNNSVPFDWVMSILKFYLGQTNYLLLQSSG